MVRTSLTRGIGRMALVALVSVAIAALAGCATAGGDTAPKASGAVSSGSKVASNAPVQTASDVQTCGECNKQGMPPKVSGQPVEQGGVQVLNVSFVNGYYSPNSFTVKAGSPVRVVFTGKAKGCLAKPMFKSLGLKGDVTSTGSATIDLGTLKAGAYKWTCAMGMNPGTITVQ